MSTYSLTLPPLPQSSIHAQVLSNLFFFFFHIRNKSNQINSTPPHCKREILHQFLPPFLPSFYKLGSYYFQVPIVRITFFPLIWPFRSVVNRTNLRQHFDSTYLSHTCSRHQTLLIVLFFSFVCLFVGFFVPSECSSASGCQSCLLTADTNIVTPLNLLSHSGSPHVNHIWSTAAQPFHVSTQLQLECYE